jgi:hypothetical protein
MSLTKNVHWNQSIVVISLAKNMRWNKSVMAFRLSQSVHWNQSIIFTLKLRCWHLKIIYLRLLLEYMNMWRSVENQRGNIFRIFIVEPFPNLFSYLYLFTFFLVYPFLVLFHLEGWTFSAMRYFNLVSARIKNTSEDSEVWSRAFCQLAYV